MPDKVGRVWEETVGGKRYDAGLDPIFLARFRRSPYIRLIQQYANLTPGSRVLEPGCGSAKFSFVFAAEGHQAVVLDYVTTILNDVRSSDEELTGHWPGRIAGYFRGSLEQLPFADNSFDLVLNEGVVEHWLDDTARLHVLRQMVHVTRPGGVVAILVPNGSHPLMEYWDRTEVFKATPPMTYYSARRLAAELEQAGLHDVISDGVYPWRSWTRFGTLSRLDRLAAALDRFLPTPKMLRRRWAINLIAIGRK